MSGAYLGPGFDSGRVREELAQYGAVTHDLTGESRATRTAELLAAGKVVGWMQGRMEFGPRALGARSILGDPRSAAMQRTMNLKIKYRESFRPFAPAVLAEHAEAWFDLRSDSPYMLLVAEVAAHRRLPCEDEALFGIDKLKVARTTIPAVTHVDYSARVQTVHRGTNPRFHALLTAFHDLTGCPVLVNTSFNVRGEPIVCAPSDAYRCFMRTEMDALVVEDLLLIKEEQPPWEEGDWRSELVLD